MTESTIQQTLQHKLPKPDKAALEMSYALFKIICEDIGKQGGTLPFSAFMQHALYENDLGYYRNPLSKFGRGGDFTTAPETSSLFGKCIAHYCQTCLSQLDVPNIVEFGAGSGKLCIDILRTLDAADALPKQYYIVDVSHALQKRQQEAIITALPKRIANKVVYLDSLPDDESLEAVIIANEVLDAMPVELFRIHDNNIYLRCVSVKNAALYFTDVLIDSGPIYESVQRLKTTYNINTMISEINPWIKPWIQSMYALLKRGAVLLFDYGYSEAQYYDLTRTQGTLMCHYQHIAHTDPLFFPGLQDITAHVNFTEVANSAKACGFDINGFSNQAMFLLSNNLIQFAEADPQDDSFEQSKLNQELKALTYPDGMGEKFHAMGLSKNLNLDSHAFSMRSMLHRL